MSTDESVTRDIAAPPDLVWALVSDLPRMGEWSNENVGGEWTGGATGSVPGATFRGANRNGLRRWKSKVTVVDSVPGEVFRFSVRSLGLPISEWVYELEPTDGGCRVTESWTDQRPGWFKPFAGLATGVKDRAEHTRVGMARTLELLAATAESSS
jgi:Polyketide cyclase / dehydrase and lipid transport